MPRGLNWDRAKADTARARRKAERAGAFRLPQDRGKPVTPKQKQYLASLARQAGKPAPDVTTAHAASVAIGHLQRLLDAKQQ